MRNGGEETPDGGSGDDQPDVAAIDDPMQEWERAVTSNGIPYFISHEHEKTTWDHPLMTKALNALEGLNIIKFSAYRMAMKLRLVQKTTNLDRVTLSTVEESLHERHLGYGDITWESMLTVTETEALLRGLFEVTNSKTQLLSIDVDQCTDLALNWILNTYDSGRTGLLHTMSVLTGIVLLCQGNLVDKYQALISYIVFDADGLSRTDCERFLQDCLQIPRQFFESVSFGGTNIQLVVTSLESYVNMPRSEDDSVFLVAGMDMIDWLLEEPQTIVWLPTMHRLAAAETVRHEAKCNSCKAYPIIGMRYRCLKCINYDMCQTCFFAGKSAQKHKEKHPVKEYCMLTTSGEDVKDFVRSVKNKLSTKKRRRRYVSRRKNSYLPLPTDRDLPNMRPSRPDVNNAADVHEDIQKLRQRLVKLEAAAGNVTTDNVEDDHLVTLQLLGHHPTIGPEQTQTDAAPARPETSAPHDDIQGIVDQLNDEKRRILVELEALRATTGSRTSQANTDHLEADKRRLLEKIAMLEQHNRTLEEQLQRLRELLNMKETPRPAARTKKQVLDTVEQLSDPTRSSPRQMAYQTSAASVTPVMLAASQRPSEISLVPELSRQHEYSQQSAPQPSSRASTAVDAGARATSAHSTPTRTARAASATTTIAAAAGTAVPAAHATAAAILVPDITTMVATTLRDLTIPSGPFDGVPGGGEDIFSLGRQVTAALESLTHTTTTVYNVH